MQGNWKRLVCLVLCMAMVMPMVPQIRVQAAETADPAVQAPAQMETRPLEEERLLAKEKLLQSEVVEISTREEFLAIMEDYDGEYHNYLLTADIDLGEIVPLGYDPETGTTTPFRGSLDGNGYTLSYSMKEVPGCVNYGLFSQVASVTLEDVYLNVDMNLSLGEAQDYCIGAVAGSSSSICELAYCTIAGSINVTSAADTGSITASFKGLGEGWSGTIDSSTVELDVDIHSSGDAKVNFQGVTSANSVFDCAVSLYGNMGEIILHQGGSESFCTFDLTVTDYGYNGTIKVVQSGLDHIVKGDIAVHYIGDGSAFTCQVLSSSQGSSFCGSLNVTCENQYAGYREVACAAYCENVEVEAEVNACGSWSQTIYGLNNCRNSVFEGSINAGGENANYNIIGAYHGENNQVNAQLLIDGDRPAVSALYGGRNSCFEGEIQIRGYNFFDAQILRECTSCTFDGEVLIEPDYSPVDMAMAKGGTENIVLADIQGDVENMLLLTEETGSYFKGSYTGPKWGYVTAINGTDCFVEADIDSGFCALFSETTKDSCFEGDVQCVVFIPFSETAENCYADADVTVVYDDGSVAAASNFIAVNTEGTNCNFDGDIDIYQDPELWWWDAAYVISTFPIGIYLDIGNFNTESIQDGIFYHLDGCYACEKGETAPAVVFTVEEYESLSKGFRGRHSYEVAIWLESPGSESNSSSAADSWDGSIDPVDKTYQPDADNASYIFRVVTPDEKPLSGGSLVFNGLRYSLNDGGVVTVRNGPGFISPLAVYSAEGKELKVYDCYRPIPDAINTLRVGDDLNLKPDLVAQGGTAVDDAEAAGAEVEVAGVKYPLVMMAMASDLDLQAGDLNIASNFNEDTKRYEVILSTEHLESGRADSWKDTWKEYSRVLKEGKIKDEPSKKKIKLLGMECDVSLTAVMEFEYDASTGGFKIVSGTGRLKFGGDDRDTRPFAVPAFYWTVSYGAEIEGTVGVDSTYDEVVKAAVVRFMGAIDLQGFLEGALGTGVRPANLYAEVGLKGTLAGGVQFPWVSLRDSAEVKFTADAFTEARAWVLGGRRQYTFANVQLWPRPANGMTTLSIPQNTEMKILPRNYANRAVTLAGDSTGGFASVVDDTRADYPYSYLRLERLSDGRHLLVYTDDDTSRASADRSVLRAVIGTVDSSTNAISWGESIAIDGDGTGDYNVNVSVNGTEAALIWQDMDKTFGEGSGLTTGEMADHVELSRAILDCSGEVPVVTENIAVTSGNSLCEEHTVICHWGSETRTAWVTSTVNDPMVTQDGEVYTVWLDGEKVAETQQVITGIVLLADELLWSTQTGNGSDLWMLDADGAVTQLKAEGIKDLQSRGEYFCFTEGTSLYRGKGSCDTLTEIDRNESYTNTVRVSDDGQVYFLDNKTDSARLYAFRSGSARPVADFDGFVSCWDISGGRVAALVKHGFATEDTSDDAAFLRSIPEQTIVDIQVGELYCDNTFAAPGSQVTMSATVFNNGTDDLGEISISAADSSGAALVSENLYVSIPAGESAVAEFSFTVPDDFTSQDVTVTIADTAQTVRLGKSNLKVETIWKKYRPDRMQVKVTNTGLGEATGTVTVSDGTDTLLTQTVTVPQGEQQLLEVAFAHHYTDPTAICAVLTEADASAAGYDNEDSVSVTYGPTEAQILVFDNQVLTVGDTVSIQCRPVPADAAVPKLTYLVDDPEVVSIDAQGKLTALKLGTATVTALTEQGKTTEFTVDVVDIFPLKEARTLTLQSWESVNYIFTPEADGKYALYIQDKDSDLFFYIQSPDGYGSSTVIEGNRMGEWLNMKAGERYTIRIANYAEEAVTGTFIMEEYSGTGQEHSYAPQVTAPTCTERGYTTYFCSHCGDSFVDDYQDAQGHSWDKWQVVQAATADKDGEKMRQCSRCQEQEKQPIPATGTDPEETKPTEPIYDNPFEDVFEGDYYYTPVLWAVNKGITNGMDATHFAPEGTCTRAQIVTFLWRSCGSPAPAANNPFTDVPAGQWYTDAVLWAVGEGITTGTSATTFSPDAGCTRGQVATFLWRSQGQPAVSGENIFTDIASGAYYYDAVLWAVANEITNGMGEGLFAPDATCTRGQIVTFLYRAMT